MDSRNQNTSEDTNSVISPLIASSEELELNTFVNTPHDESSTHRLMQHTDKTASDGSPDAPFLKYSIWRRWSAVAIMVTGFLTGIAFACGHHFHYQTLHGQEVGTIEQQQWAIRIGSFFAVATGRCLRIAISSAYIQYVWQRLKHKATCPTTVDNAFEALSSVLAFGCLALFKTMYVGIVMLVVFWSVNDSLEMGTAMR